MLSLPTIAFVALVVAGCVALARLGHRVPAIAVAVLWVEMIGAGALRRYPFLDLRTSHFLVVVSLVCAAVGAVAVVVATILVLALAAPAAAAPGLVHVGDFDAPIYAASPPRDTLLTYYRHTMGSDPLVRLGRQDISVHVDFTSLATAAHQAGLDVLGVTSQRTLLRNLGLEPLLRQRRSPEDRQAVEQLLDPGGLGRIGALFLARGLAGDGEGDGDGYQPVGLVGGRDWPPVDHPPTLAHADDAFMQLWREAFALE
jgi:hypothetical protein